MTDKPKKQRRTVTSFVSVCACVFDIFFINKTKKKLLSNNVNRSLAHEIYVKFRNYSHLDSKNLF